MSQLIEILLLRRPVETKTCKPDFETGHDEIDDHHHMFCSFLKSFEELLVRPVGEDTETPPIKHFKGIAGLLCNTLPLRKAGDEMKTAGCSETIIAGHWRMHKDFENGLYHICRTIMSDGVVFDTSTFAILKMKFFHHILHEDRAILCT